MLVLELSSALVVGFRHHADVVYVLGDAVPLVGEADVAESALVPQWLEVLLR